MIDALLQAAVQVESGGLTLGPVLTVSTLTSLVVGAVGYGAVREKVSRGEDFRKEIRAEFSGFKSDVNARFDAMDDRIGKILNALGRLEGAEHARHRSKV